MSKIDEMKKEFGLIISVLCVIASLVLLFHIIYDLVSKVVK